MHNISKLITLGEAARKLPQTNGKPVHPATLYRWCTKGLNGVYLEYWYSGKMYTTEEAIEAFLKQRAEAHSEQHKAKRKHSAANNNNKGRRSRKKRDNNADAILKGYGIDTE